METTTKLSTIETKVESLMDVYPETRSNDRLLIQTYLKRYHGVTSFADYTEDSSLPTIESITRLRRKIQRAGRWCATLASCWSDIALVGRSACGKSLMIWAQRSAISEGR